MTPEERLEKAERQSARMMSRYRLLLATVVAMGLVMAGIVAIGMGAGRRDRAADGPASPIVAAGPRDIFDEVRDAAGDGGGERAGQEGVKDSKRDCGNWSGLRKSRERQSTACIGTSPQKQGRRGRRIWGGGPAAGVEELKTRLSQLESEQRRNEKEVRDLREDLHRIQSSVPALGSQLEREHSGNEQEIKDLQDGLRRIEMRMLTLESRVRN